MLKFNRKFVFAILLPLLILPMINIGYVHWTDKVRKQVKLHVACFKAGIISYKCYSEIDDKYISVYPPDDEIPDIGVSSIQIKTNKASNGGNFWIGLRLANEGPFPVVIHEPEYSIKSPSNNIDYICKQFYYGPYKRGGDMIHVWSDIQGSNYQEKLDSTVGVIDVGDTVIPMTLDETFNKAVLWIYIEITDGPVGEFSIKIKVTPQSDPILP